jgi:cobyrinic acid a,c-diamide synthase
LRRFAETRPVHGECGGYMVLGEGLVDAGGATHAMAGLLPGSLA